MDIEIKESSTYGHSLVEFTLHDARRVVSLQMPSDIAVILQAQNEKAKMVHGLKMEGKLVAVFEMAEDRDYCRDILEDVWPRVKWEEVTC